MLARALSATGTERSRVLEVVQAAGARRRAGRPSAHARLRARARLRGRDRAFVAKLKRPGEVEILQYRRRSSCRSPTRSAPAASPGAPARACRSSSACACAAKARCPAPASSCSRSPLRSATRRAARVVHRNLPPDPVLRLPVMRPRLRFLLPVLALAARPPGRRAAPTSPTTKRSTRTAPRAATCSTATGCSGSTTKTRASSSASCAATSTAGWTRSRSRTCGTSATPPTSRWRRDRLVPQGLRAARRRRRAGLGAALRVGQLPHAGVAQRPPVGENTGAYIPFELPPERLQAPRARTGSWCAWTRAASITDFPPARPEHRRRARPAAGGTTPASSARST